MTVPILVFLVWIASLLFTKVLTPRVIAPAQEPSRIVSLNVATDELLIDLIGTDRIAALSNFSVDESVSFCYEEAKKIPFHLSGSIEEVKALEPDFLFLSPFSEVTVLNFFTSRDEIPYLIYQMPANIEMLKSSVLKIGEIVGAVEKAEEIASQLDFITNVQSSSLNKHAVIFVQSFLNATGVNTLIDDVLSANNCINVVADKGVVNLSYERFLSLNFEYVITTRYLAESLVNDKFTKMHKAVSEKKFIYVTEREINSINHNILKLHESIRSFFKYEND